MFLRIAAVIDDNGRGLAAPRQGEGQSQGDAVTVKPAGLLLHNFPLILSGASSE